MLTSLTDYFALIRNKLEKAGNEGNISEAIRLWGILRDECEDQIRKLERAQAGAPIER